MNWNLHFLLIVSEILVSLLLRFVFFTPTYPVIFCIFYSKNEQVFKNLTLSITWAKWNDPAISCLVNSLNSRLSKTQWQNFTMFSTVIVFVFDGWILNPMCTNIIFVNVSKHIIMNSFHFRKLLHLILIQLITLFPGHSRFLHLEVFMCTWWHKLPFQKQEFDH